MVTRRQLLGGVAALGAAVPIAAAPAARADAALDLDLEVTDWELSDREQIDRVGVIVRNQTDRSVKPVFLCWCSTRITQQPWTRERGPMTLPSGEVARYEIAAPKSICSVRLRPNTMSNIAVYDRGTEQHESVQFVPEIDHDRLGEDGQDECGEYSNI